MPVDCGEEIVEPLASFCQTERMELIVDFGRVARLADLPEGSIALDGFVRGPQIDAAGRRYSFDHHEDCVRHATSATCVQVLDALLVGFDPDGFRVYVNDVDADTVLSVFLLSHPDKAADPAVRRLVEAVGKIDAHGPAYPLPEADHRLARTYLEAILEAERNARRKGTYGGESIRGLLDESLRATGAWVNAGFPAAEIAAPAPYRVLFSEGNMALIEGDREMMGLAYADGWQVLIATLPAKDASRAYTIAKRSEFVAFDVPGLLAALHAVEPGWGGGSTVGGAPRNADGTRSCLDPETVWKIALGNR